MGTRTPRNITKGGNSSYPFSQTYLKGNIQLKSESNGNSNNNFGGIYNNNNNHHPHHGESSGGSNGSS